MSFQKYLFLLITCFCLNSCYYSGNEKVTNRVFQEFIGSFIIDTNKTNLGNYSDPRYKFLEIKFTKDSLFSLNMQVPFIYDSVGRWVPTKGGLEDWNWLFYKNNPNISTQFTEIWTNDSIFYLNSVTPQKGQEAIQKIYFKKS